MYRRKRLAPPPYLALPQIEAACAKDAPLHPALTRVMVDRHVHRLAATLLDLGIGDEEISRWTVDIIVRTSKNSSKTTISPRFTAPNHGRTFRYVATKDF